MVNVWSMRSGNGATWIKREAEKELFKFYPKDADGATPIAYLWARTIQCEGPGCGAEVPLIRSLWLAKKANRSVACRLVPNQKAKRVDFQIHRLATRWMGGSGRSQIQNRQPEIRWYGETWCGNVSLLWLHDASRGVREQLKSSGRSQRCYGCSCVLCNSRRRIGPFDDYRLTQIRKLPAFKADFSSENSMLAEIRLCQMTDLPVDFRRINLD